MTIRPFSFLLCAVLLIAGSTYGSTDAELLTRLSGYYTGRERVKITHPPESRGQSRLQAVYIMPSGTGVMRGVWKERGLSVRLKGRIRKVICRGNRVIYKGTSRLNFRGRTLSALRFKATATARGTVSERLVTSAGYGGGSPGRFVRFRGNFKGKK